MKRTAGFTLIELAVVIGLVVILAAIAVPAYFHLTSGNRVTGAVNALAATLSLARSEAIARGEQVTVCPSANATGEAPLCDTGGWQEGWLVFVDANGNGRYDAGAGDVLFRVHGPVGDGVEITDPGANSWIAFNRMGFAQPTFAATPGTSSLTIVACPSDKRGAAARAVVVNLSGDVATAARAPDGGSFSCS